MHAFGADMPAEYDATADAQDIDDFDQEDVHTPLIIRLAETQLFPELPAESNPQLDSLCLVPYILHVVTLKNRLLTAPASKHQGIIRLWLESHAVIATNATWAINQSQLLPGLGDLILEVIVWARKIRDGEVLDLEHVPMLHSYDVDFTEPPFQERPPLLGTARAGAQMDANMIIGMLGDAIRA